MDNAPATSLSSTGGSSLARKLALACLAGAAVFVGLALYADGARVLRVLSTFRASTFGIALVLATLNYVARFVRWEMYLRVLDVRVPRTDSVLVFLAGFVMSVTPGKVGEVFKSLLLAERHQIPVSRTAPIVIAERVTDLVSLVLLTSIGALVFPNGVSVTIIGAFVSALLLLACAAPPIGRFFVGVIERVPVAKRVAPRASEAFAAMHTISRPGPLLFAIVTGVIAWTAECIALGVVLVGFAGVGVDWLGSTFAYAVATIAGAVSPGGLVVTESTMTTMLVEIGGSGIDAATASAATILVRLATLWWAVLVGAIALAIWRHRNARGRS